MKPIIIEQLGVSFLIVVGAFVIYFLLSNLLKRFNFRAVNERKRETFISVVDNILKYLIVLIALFLILDKFKVDAKTLLASIGVIGVVVGLAIQDIIKAFLNGFFIILDDQYNVGDIVTINGFKGEIIALGLKTTKIRSDIGDIKSISNNIITEVINHTLSDNLAVIDIKVSYDNDLKLVEELLSNFCKNSSKNIKNIEKEITLFTYNNYYEYGVEFRLVAYVKPLKSEEVSRLIRQKVITILKDNNIKLGYPRVIVNE
jgi:small-conductance mechanosensitive channel